MMDVDWIVLAHGSDEWRVAVMTVMNLVLK